MASQALVLLIPQSCFTLYEQMVLCRRAISLTIFRILSALFTFSFWRVCLHVSLQTESLTECSSARFAFVWPLSGMCSHVLLQRRWVSEQLLTIVALVWFVTRVISDVLVERLHLLKLLATQFA